MLKTLTTLTVASLTTGTAFAEPATPNPETRTPATPNIVVILADDLRADCIGAVNPRIHTPNIDRIARQGVRFDNAYIMGGNCAAVCTPSRVMLMSGRTLFNLPKDIYAEGNKPSVPVMSTVFRQAGYDSLYCGKHGNTYRPANVSFDKFIDIGHPGAKKKAEEQAYYTAPVTSWLAEPARKNKPFFVFYAPSIPHDPLCPLPEDLARYAGDKCPPLPPNAAAQHADVAGFNLHDTNIRTFDVPGMGKFKTPLNLKQWPQVLAHYYAYTTLLDRQVGRILDELERTGADKNTLIIFTSDNGHSFADNGLIHKQSVYEQDIRVPMILSGPGIPTGKVSDAFVYISDLFPTLCEKIGTPVPASVKARSFLSSLLDPAKPHRQTLYFMYADILFAQKLGRDNDEMRAYRDGQYKIILFNNQRVRLFDLKADPYEMKDLAKEQPERVAAMIAAARQAGQALGEDQEKMKFWQLFDGKIPQPPPPVSTEGVRAGAVAPPPQATLPAPDTGNQRMAAYREAKFGMFIHWGLYAIPAQGEWFMFSKKMPVAKYAQFAPRFNPVKFNAGEWVRVAKDAGMKYIVITAKHHDGFAMYDSKVSPFNIVAATPFKRDPLKELADACQKEGLGFGFYYSHGQDWRHPGGAISKGTPRWDAAQKGDHARYLNELAFPQVKELVSHYGPLFLLWFDTPWEIDSPTAKQFADMVHAAHPAAYINSRLRYHGYEIPDCTPAQLAELREIGVDYLSYRDKSIPAVPQWRDWETCMTLNDSWGYTKNTNWKSPAVLIGQLVDIASKGGNFLLNVGPDAQGVIPAASVKNLKVVGEWLKVNGEAIYGAGPSPFPPPAQPAAVAVTKIDKSQKPTKSGANVDDGAASLPGKGWYCTTKPGKLYIHLFKWPQGSFELAGMPDVVTKAYLLSDRGNALPVTQSGGKLTVQLPAAAPHPIATVLCLEHN